MPQTGQSPDRILATPHGALAKTNPENPEGSRWLSLLAHSADAGAVAEAILSIPEIADRVGADSGSKLGKTECARVALLVSLHDLGKVSVGFQRRLRGGEAGLAAAHPRHGDHVDCLLALLNEADSDIEAGLFLEAAGWPALAKWSPKMRGIFVAILGHHGPLIAESHEPDLWRPVAGHVPAVEARRLFLAAHDWFLDAFEAGEPLPSCPKFRHAIRCLAAISDRIASDALIFWLDEDAGAERIAFSRKKAARLRSEWLRDPEKQAAFKKIASSVEFGFEKQFGEQSPWLLKDLRPAAPKLA